MERLGKLDEELANLHETSDGDEGPLAAGEGRHRGTIRTLKEELESAHREAERWTGSGDLAKAAEIRYGQVPDLAAPGGRGDQAPGGAAVRAEDAQAGGR